MQMTRQAQRDRPRLSLRRANSVKAMCLARRLGAVIVSIVVSLAVAEWAVAAVRDGAFPYLNIFVPDAQFGVRLEPDATTATRSPLGRVTDIRINKAGFRGAQWPMVSRDAAVVSAGRVLLLGDSQVFGYGVDEAEALARRLQASPSISAVLNAGVPTWGPGELVQILGELAPKYRPETVVFVANLANDWFETRLPNRERMTARDGWLRHRQGLSAESPADLARDAGTDADFPLGSWLMGKSHLVYVIQRLFATRSAGPPRRVSAADRLLKDLPHLRKPVGPFASRLGPFLTKARQTCADLGCRVVVAILPLDVQVDADAWAKYPGSAPADLSSLAVLTQDLLRDAATLGLDAIDLGPSLEAASPGAFLADDYHLSAVGHAAVDRALAELIAAPHPGSPCSPCSLGSPGSPGAADVGPVFAPQPAPELRPDFAPTLTSRLTPALTSLLNLRGLTP